MCGDSLSQPCVHDSEFGECSRESLKVVDAPVTFYDKIKNAVIFFFSSGFPTEHVNHGKIRCTHCLTEAVT